MTKQIDTHHTYKPPWSGIYARCRLRIYEHEPHTVVLLTELPDNPGISVTNWAAELATEIAAQYKLDLGRTLWIEHYPAAGEHPEHFDRIRFDWGKPNRLRQQQYAPAADNPQWQRLTLEEVEIATGANLTPLNQMLDDLGLETADGRDFDDWDAWELS